MVSGSTERNMCDTILGTRLSLNLGETRTIVGKLEINWGVDDCRWARRSLLLRDSRYIEKTLSKCTRKMAWILSTEDDDFLRVRKDESLFLFFKVSVIFSLESTISWLKTKNLLNSNCTGNVILWKDVAFFLQRLNL